MNLRRILFFILATVCLYPHVSASKVSLNLDPGEEFAELASAQYKVQQVHELAQPTDSARNIAISTGFLGDLGLNIGLHYALRKHDAIWAHILSIVSWIGGTALLGWTYTKTLVARQRLMQLFHRLVQLSKHKNLARALEKYDTTTLEDTGTRKAFRSFSEQRFCNEQEAQTAAHQFLNDRIAKVARRLYWLGLLSSGAGGATLSHLIAGTLPLKNKKDDDL